VAFVTGLSIRLQGLAVDGFGQDAGTGGFAHSPWTTKQKGMRQVIVADGVFQSGGNMFLTHDSVKGLGAVFPGRNDKFFHSDGVLCGLQGRKKNDCKLLNSMSPPAIQIAQYGNK
jgi:hypothetical protein